MKELLSTFLLLLVLCTVGFCQRVVYPCPVPMCIQPCRFYTYGTNGCVTCTCASQKPACPTCTCPNGGTPVAQDIKDLNGCNTCICIPRPTLSRPRPALCSLPVASGMCLAAMTKYAYNPVSGLCEVFIYGGCGGNQNNFNSLRQCQTICNATVSDVPKPPKPGTCPPALGIGVCVEACSDDGNCPMDQKCCSNGCGRTCQSPFEPTQPPAPPAPPQGTCPPPGLTQDMCLYVRFAPCRTNSECTGGMQCCYNGCGNACMATTTPTEDCTSMKCNPREICKLTPTGPTCLREECPTLPGDLVRPAVCRDGCNNHSDCSDQQICCSLDACSTQCMTPAPPCPVFRCMQCPLTRPYRAYDENGCQTCTCVSTPPLCSQCVCPVGSRPKEIRATGFLGCQRCECEKDEPVPPVDPCESMKCNPREICKLTSTGPTCLREECPTLPGDLVRPAVCSEECNNHSNCSDQQICCSLDACSTQCMTPAPPCPVFRCLPCPLASPYRAYDENGCQTCTCVSTPLCPQCVCPVGSRPKEIRATGFLGCQGCECEKDEPVPPVNDPCKTVICGPGEKCETQVVQCLVAPCPPPTAICLPYLAPPKPGDCPSPALGGGTCLTECSGDVDCSGSKKCCSNSCAMICQEPAVSEPCQNPRCGPNEKCELRVPQCFTQPCPNIMAVCVPDVTVGPPVPPEPLRISDSCANLVCNPDEDCRMRETICPQNSHPFECTGSPRAVCFSKSIPCAPQFCNNRCSNGYLVAASGCMSASCTCAPAERPTCNTHRCGVGEHCEMQYTEPCIADASCWRSPVCVRDSSSILNCEMQRNPGVVSNTPVLYYQPRGGCPSGSKLVRMNDDFTELCCRTRAVFSDKPACENGSPQLSTEQYQCGINAVSNRDGVSGFFSWFFNRNKACRLGMVCTQHIEGGWSTCCQALPPPQQFRFNTGQQY